MNNSKLKSAFFSKTIFGLLLSILCFACSPKVTFNEAEERAAILELHEQQRTYHFEKMAEEFAALLSDAHISVNRGAITHPTRAENTERFKNYFNIVEFEKWDDLEPPIIKFSEDFSLAYTIVDKEVIVNYQNEEGSRERESTKYSWVAIYKRYAEGWKIDCVASTNKPSVKL